MTVESADAPEPLHALGESSMNDSQGCIHAVDLFCGIGGLTHGLGLAGIHVKAGIDNDPTCKYAFATNNPGAEFVCKSVRGSVLPRPGRALHGRRDYRPRRMRAVPAVLGPQ